MTTVTHQSTVSVSWSISICEFGWWLFIILVRVFYFIYLAILTIEDFEFGSNLPTSAKLCRAGLLIAGALWLWSHMELFLVCQFVRLIAVTLLDLQFGPIDNSEKVSSEFVDDNFQFYWNIYLGARLIAGILWLWSHKRLVFIDSVCIAIFIIYRIVIMVYGDNNGDNTITERSDNQVPSNGEEGADTGCDSDSSSSESSSWQCYLDAMIGHNFNIGGGTQTIGGVTIKIKRCRDVIFGIPRKARKGSDGATNSR